MADFLDRVVVVTGAATGIGRASALAFAREGALVIATHLRQPGEIASLRDEAAPLAGEIRAVEVDVTDAGQVASLVETALAWKGQLDVLVNNAGVSLVKPLLETTEDDWDRVLAADLRSVFLCCRAAVPALSRAPGASIVNVASELAQSGRANFTAYCAAKAGVLGFTRALARELAPAIRVNAVAPGPTRTPLLEAELAVPGHVEPLAEIPLGRFASPDEIAETIVFLASARAGYYCGAVLGPNGGTVMA